MGGVVMVGLGCEGFQIPRFKEAYGVTESDTFRTMTIQETGGTKKTVDAGVAAIKEMLPVVNAVKRETIPVGQQLLAEEADLNRRFADRTITPDQLSAAVAALGEIQARLRAAHLSYHLSTPALLTQEQMRRYGELRGYAGASGHQPRHPN